MTRRAIIENGIVTNVIEAGPDFEIPGKQIVDAGDAGIGWSYSGGVFTAPEPTPAPVPASVTRRQILTGLAVVGWITEQEALAALTVGATPAAVDAVIAALPADQQFATRMKWAGFQSAFRDDEMVAALAALEGKTNLEVDGFFRLCAGIE